MTYTVGSLIEATDYNGFVSTNAANVNAIWSTGVGDRGYGQSAMANVTVGATVAATSWASLVNNISTIANHQGTTITSRTAPVAGNTIVILNAVNTDITALTNNRGNAAASGTAIETWTGTTAKTTTTGSGNAAWTITFTHTVTFPSADQARYFFNAGGLVRWRTSKSSTGTVADPEWNDLASTLVGNIYISGGTSTQVIAGTSYTGTTKIGGTGTPTTLTTGTGFYDLTTTAGNVYVQFADTSPYTGQYIGLALSVNSNTAPTVLTLTTTWRDPGGSPPGSTDVITGGTDTASPFTAFGTAPATVVTLVPPSSTYLGNTWGTPTVAASVV
jgi:hypothetical protein